ncbi:tetratricopeptide repeat protein [Nakamurella deserti]|uniref:tetratricopeptide repeat protein n=1 Tax=Nakamurella deserti TaxID=2164074 RepID=UPI000DBE5934|nr:tetratricopeptide repeat protein [Nakamurella deserti]
MNPRLVVALLSAALIAYFVLIGDKALILFKDGSPATIGLGVAALLMPLIGAILLYFELRFGWRTQQLGRRLGDEGGLPEQPDLPTRPSGRIDKAAALPHFEKARIEAENDPENWRVWFRLADAYDLAGDRKRARAAMRTAIELEARRS